jgi:hypothetical protein
MKHLIDNHIRIGKLVADDKRPLLGQLVRRKVLLECFGVALLVAFLVGSVDGLFRIGEGLNKESSPWVSCQLEPKDVER